MPRMTRRDRKRLRRSRLRTAKQPRGTLVAAAVLAAFMVIVYFAAPDVVLPTFFQRLVGIANASIAMLVVIFAVREFGNRWNRVRVPGLGRVNTSKVLGALVFVAVLAWWLSPWAPIQAASAGPTFPVTHAA